MNGLDSTKPFHCLADLSSRVARQQGSFIYQVEQRHQHYKSTFILKGLKQTATILAHQQFNQERFYYQTFQHESFCLPAQILPYPLQECLCLPYVTTIPIDSVSFEARIERFIQLCQQVQRLHQLGYVHGDLKSAHFLLWENQMKLIDFAQVSPYSKSHQIITATPSHMSPELFHGHAASPASDIYALGIVLYQWLMGHKPFQATTYQAWATQHCQEPVPLLPIQLRCYQAILDRMLAKQLVFRYAHITQLLDDLHIKQSIK